MSRSVLSRNRGSKSKITEAYFTARSKELAVHGKNVVHHCLVTSHAFPLDKEIFVWACIQSAAIEYNMSDVINMTKRDNVLRGNLIAFVSDINLYLMFL